MNAREAFEAFLLFVHGWGGNAANHAASIRAVVETGGRAVAFDAPGQGRSEGAFSCAPAFAWAIQGVARQTGRLRGIVAHSLGGGAACLALGNGVQADRAVLLAASGALEPVLVDMPKVGHRSLLRAQPVVNRTCRFVLHGECEDPGPAAD